MAETASMEQQWMADRAARGGSPSKGDDVLFVEFSMKTVLDEERSNKEGRPIYYEAEYIRIQAPGERDNIPERPVGEVERKRFGKLYKAWKEDQTAPQNMTGTPLTMWPRINRPLAEEMKHYKLYTVEQLAACSPERINIPGMVSLKQQAADWLEVARQGAPAAEMRAELEKRDKTNAALLQQVQELAAQVQKMQSKKKATASSEE